jgi:regulatory protein
VALPPPPRSRRKAEPSLGARALRLLARRDHTRLELERKLAPYAAGPEELAAVLDDFTARGWISEERVAEQVVHSKRARLGPARIRQALLQRGVSAGLVESALGTLKGTELEAARAVWSRKFRTAAATPSDRARQVRFLQARGFNLQVAMRVVNRRDEPEDDGG